MDVNGNMYMYTGCNANALITYYTCTCMYHYTYMYMYVYMYIKNVCYPLTVIILVFLLCLQVLFVVWFIIYIHEFVSYCYIAEMSPTGWL